MIPLAAHVVMTLIMLCLPYLTRREILFGVVLPADFRSRPEGLRAIREFQSVVAIAAVCGLISIPLLTSRFILTPILASGVVMGRAHKAVKTRSAVEALRPAA